VDQRNPGQARGNLKQVNEMESTARREDRFRSRIHVLVINDDSATRAKVGEALAASRFDFEIEEVRTPTEAVERARDSSFHAIVLDASPLDACGLAGIDRVRTLFPEVPLIVLGDRSDERSALCAVRRGAEEYLAKGLFDPSLLGLLVGQVVFRHQRRKRSVRRCERNRHLATHDALTGLGNRAMLDERLRQAMRIADLRGRSAALLFVDLDGLKRVNDGIGHAAGDEVLRIMARRLERSVRRGDTVVRLGGDEFVVVLPNLERTEDAERAAEGIRGSLSERLVLSGGTKLELAASVGVAVYPRDGRDADSLLEAADAAMFRDKRHPRRRLRTLADLPVARASLSRL
jgi:diguanylate cyclase (GGDEF)-like protein